MAPQKIMMRMKIVMKMMNNNITNIFVLVVKYPCKVSQGNKITYKYDMYI